MKTGVRKLRHSARKGSVVVFGLVAALACLPATAQLGPVDVRGYGEYRYDRVVGTEGTPQGHRLTFRTDFATYVWRPWILTAAGGFNLVYSQANGGDERQDSDSLGGNLRLNFLPRSQFPLSIYYLDNTTTADSTDIFSRGVSREYGLTQQLISRRYGRYSLDWKKGEATSFVRNSHDTTRVNDFESLQLNFNKSFGTQRVSLTSRYLDLGTDTPLMRTESLRHTFRHNFRTGINFSWRNVAYYIDELQSNENTDNDRNYYQFSSVVNWTPNTRRRLLVSGRGLLQGSETGTELIQFGQELASLSGTATYYLTERLTVSGSAGVSRSESDDHGRAQLHYEQLSAAFRSLPVALWGGNYSYNTNIALANRENRDESGTEGQSVAGITLGHGYSRRLPLGSANQAQLRLTQGVGTNVSSDGRERNLLRHGLHIMTSARGNRVERNLRLSLTDRRTLGDEQRVDQLANLQLSLRSGQTSDRQWSGNVSVQYGRNEIVEPVDAAGTSKSIGYSVGLDYRHNNLWGVRDLDFNSELRLLSSDLETDDPLDPEFGIETHLQQSYWRNRLQYTIGLLWLQGIVMLREVDNKPVAGITLTVRRYFGA